MLTDMIKKTKYSSAVIPFYVHVSNVRSDGFDRFGRREKLWKNTIKLSYVQ